MAMHLLVGSVRIITGVILVFYFFLEEKVLWIFLKTL
jgi:hypothetical protein